MLLVAVVIAAMCWVAGVRADFNQCLGLEMATMLTIPSCMELFSTCQVGVNMLNQKLGDTAYKPVSLISASESKTLPEDSTKIAMLVQLAPLTDCLSASATANDDSCKFDMTNVEFYSILLMHDFGASWKLEGYKRHRCQMMSVRRLWRNTIADSSMAASLRLAFLTRTIFP
ncbi:hypothetical protein F444_06729 [Phytophthora nicotianae P1976]|uniref:Uncharacterized protein n=1 Tax=Phytophthora nicotianae P1976 TaxID=1317066 RepID=A0A081AH61_PHYNI|nr:hypothetical protein F444_06729 [Phytophthora nicotianae P1976]